MATSNDFPSVSLEEGLGVKQALIPPPVKKRSGEEASIISGAVVPMN